MARRRTSRKKQGGLGRLLLICLVCVAVGAGGVWIARNGIQSVHGPTGPGYDPAVVGSAELSKMTHKELEAEVVRLRKAVDERDKQIADMMIERKLEQAGSAAASSKF